MASLFDLSVKVNLDQIRKDLNAVKGYLGDRAVLSSLNKAAAQSKTVMSRAIRDEYNISAGLVRERLVVRRAQKKGAAAFSAFLIGNPETGGALRSMNVIHFMERKTSLAERRKREKSGVGSQLFFRIKRGGPKQFIRGAFIGNKGRTMFIRTGSGRLPIKPVQTIGVPQMFMARKNVAKVRGWLVANLPRIVQSEVKYFLSTATKGSR